MEAIARLVDEGAETVADVGYDHGHLMTLLGRERGGLNLVGVEIQEEAHRKALQAFATDERVTLHLGDAFEPLAGADVDVAVLAGLGEHKILDLMTSQRDIAEGIRRVVLCPANFKGALRIGMAELGWRVVDEALARERQRFYPVIAYERGDAQLGEPCDFFGPLLAQREPTHLLAYLLDLRVKVGGAMEAVQDERSEMTRNQAYREAYLRTLAALEPAIETLEAYAPNP